VTDIHMPGSMDGLMLSAAVRDRWPPIKIVVVSGDARPRPDEMPDGAVFLRKPFQMESMRGVLSGML
jgi:CheY-like chemotaxis protein